VQEFRQDPVRDRDAAARLHDHRHIGGVKVIAEQLDIPSEFTIILSEGRPRQCRLAWRIGYEFGAQFVD